jgi:hypothetical protein
MLLELCNEVWKLKRHLAAEKKEMLNYSDSGLRSWCGTKRSFYWRK